MRRGFLGERSLSSLLMKKFGEAIEQTRRDEVADFKSKGTENLLEKGQWRFSKGPIS